MAFGYLQGFEMKFKNCRLVSLSTLEFNFFIVLQSNLKETLHYKRYMVSNIKNLHSVLEQFKKKILFCYTNKRSKFEVEKVAIWQYYSISGKHKAYHFLIVVFCPFQIKNYIKTGLVNNFFNARCNRVTSSLKKRNHHK